MSTDRRDERERERERFHRSMDLFTRARALPRAKRTRWLQEECGSDADLLATVQALIAKDDLRDDRFESIAPGEAGIETRCSSRLGLDLANAVLDEWSSDSATDSQSPPLPRRIGKYDVLEELARGGMGVVYRAQDPSLRRDVALKVILAGEFASSRSVDRFHNEARAAAHLDHPHIVSVYEIGEFEGRPFIAMQLLTGGNLSERLETYRRAPRKSATLVEHIARAIAFAHERGVLHRDLKPANIVFDDQNRPYVSDFGLARRMTAETSELTRSGALLGTLAYMPPEQIGSGHASTPSSDVYGLGAILYEVLCGRPPFRADASGRLLGQVLHDEPLAPTRLEPWIPRDLETICLHCLSKKAERRYASADALADDLERFRKGEPIHARPVGRLERIGRWAFRHPATALLILMVCTLTFTIPALALWYSRDVARQESELALRERKADAIRLSHAYDLWREGRHQRARELVKTLRPGEDEPEPDFAWRHLNRLVQVGRFVLPRGVGDWGARALRFVTPELVLVGSRDGFYALWDIRSHTIVARALPPTHGLAAHALSNDARVAVRLATDPQTEEFVIQILELDLGPGRESWREAFRLSTPQATALACSPAAETIYFVDRDGAAQTLRSWMPHEHTGNTTALDHETDVLGISVSPGHDAIAVHSAERLTVHQPGELAPLATLEIHGLTAQSACWTANGDRLLTIDGSGQLTTWRTGSWKPESSFPVGAARIDRLRAAPDGRLLAISKTVTIPGQRGISSVELWDLPTRSRRALLRMEAFGVTHLDFHPDGSILAGAVTQGSTHFWDVRRAAEPRRHLSAHPYHAVAIAPDNGYAVAVHDDGIERFPLTPGAALTPAATIPLAQPAGSVSALSRDATNLAIQLPNGPLSIHRLEWGARNTKPTQLTQQPVDAVAFADNSETLAAACSDGILRRWKQNSDGEWSSSPPLDSGQQAVGLVTLSPDGSLVALAHSERAEIQVWDLERRAPLHVLKRPGYEAMAMRFSPDGKRLIESRDTGYSWNLEKQISTPEPLRGHRWGVHGMDFFPDGILATASMDATVKLWDLELGEDRATLAGHQQPVRACAVSRSGQWLVSASGHVRLGGELVARYGSE